MALGSDRVEGHLAKRSVATRIADPVEFSKGRSPAQFLLPERAMIDIDDLKNLKGRIGEALVESIFR